jgi:polar amino acid transport system substrate-binding protein
MKLFLFRSVTFLLCATLVACATFIPPKAPEAVRNALAPTGTLRIGVYPGSPTSMVSQATLDDARGVSVDIGKALATQLGVKAELIVFPRVAEVVAAIKEGKVDFTITNATEARKRDVDFSQTVVSLELSYIVLPGGKVGAIADVDAPGVVVGVTQGSSSQATLSREFKNATLRAAPSLADAATQLKNREIDAFATNKAVLFELADQVPNAQVLPGRWGVEHLAVAVPKGREAGREWLNAFVVQQLREGHVKRAAERAGLRGVAVVAL